MQDFVTKNWRGQKRGIWWDGSAGTQVLAQLALHAVDMLIQHRLKNIKLQLRQWIVTKYLLGPSIPLYKNFQKHTPATSWILKILNYLKMKETYLVLVEHQLYGNLRVQGKRLPLKVNVDASSFSLRMGHLVFRSEQKQRDCQKHNPSPQSSHEWCII